MLLQPVAGWPVLLPGSAAVVSFSRHLAPRRMPEGPRSGCMQPLPAPNSLSPARISKQLQADELVPSRSHSALLGTSAAHTPQAGQDT